MIAEISRDETLSGSRLRAVVDAAADGIVLLDTDRSVTVFNLACEHMFGYTSAEIVGRDVKLLIPAFDHALHGHYLDSSRRPRQPGSVGTYREVVGQRRNGDMFPLSLAVGEAEHDGTTFFVGALHDLTERKRDEAERERVRAVGERLIEQLTASNEERGYFIHVASHDLREPLRMMGTLGGLLLTEYGPKLDDRGREFLTLATSATRQMQALVDDLADFGRLGSGAERGSWFSSDRAVNHALESLRDHLLESKAQITRDPLPPRIYGNSIRFNRLMQNLIGNAVKYVEPGVTPKVHLSASRDGDFWRFSVSDNGIGIEQRHFDFIFEPFKRLHSRTQYPGTGLGLAMCRKIVEGFGGAITVNSVPGAGSTFSFTVKAREGERHVELDG